MQEDLNRSRSCRVAIEQKPTSMDQTAIKHLLSRQKVSRWIEIALTSIETRRKMGLMDSNLSRGVEKFSRCAKTVFQRREKHRHECNQTCYSTKDPNNILSSQKHPSTIKNDGHLDPKHTHTHTLSLSLSLNNSNQFYISKTNQDSLVSIH